MQKTFILLTVLLLTGLVAASCGGGNGGEEDATTDDVAAEDQTDQTTDTPGDRPPDTPAENPTDQPGEENPADVVPDSQPDVVPDTEPDGERVLHDLPDHRQSVRPLPRRGGRPLQALEAGGRRHGMHRRGRRGRALVLCPLGHHGSERLRSGRRRMLRGRRRLPGGLGGEHRPGLQRRPALLRAGTRLHHVVINTHPPAKL
jgi:hypothetical protein